jgi:hypothetical protein
VLGSLTISGFRDINSGLPIKTLLRVDFGPIFRYRISDICGQAAGPRTVWAGKFRFARHRSVDGHSTHP